MMRDNNSRPPNPRLPSSNPFRRIVTGSIIGIIFGAIAVIGQTQAPGATLLNTGPFILACEQASARIILIDAQADWNDDDAIVWQWQASNDAHIAPEHHSWFSNPSDAKYIGGDQHVLTVASGGGMAVIDTASGRIVGYGYVGGNPHSATLLPDGHIVTVSSTGDLVQLFEYQEDASPKYQVIQKLSLTDAHGVVWDDSRGCVWALGGKQIKRFDYDLEQSSLTLVTTLDLPINEKTLQQPRHGGHDLTWDLSGEKLALSDTDNLWTFDPQSHAFAPLPPHHLRHVKSISHLSQPPHTIVMQATTEWWSDTIRSADGTWEKTLPDVKFYKARWWGL